ncbi:MAG: hypothetical protein ABMA64_18530 [Myxococcota bacterium]
MGNRWGVVALVGTAGCPFLWGPPQWATPDGDADTDTDADADADTDVDTDADADPEVAPTVEQWTVELAYDQVTLTLGLSDPDGDLEGGTVGVFVDGQLDGTYTIESLDGWDGSVGTLSTTTEVGCTSVVVAYGVTATDAAGHVGDDVTTELRIAARQDAEVGNTPISVSTTPPHVLCASHDGPPDVDAWDLTFTVGGTYSVYVVDPDDGDDHDLRLIDDEGDQILASDDLLDPDRLTWSFVAGETYHLLATQDVGGAAGAYQVMIGAPREGDR